MKKINIKSVNQSGGITGYNVKTTDQTNVGGPPPKKKKNWSPLKWIITITTVAASIVTIIAYFKTKS